MRYWYFAVILAGIAIGLGAWARHTAFDRDFKIVFAASGEEAIQWAETAKKDQWVEIVTMEVVDGEVANVPVRSEEIDSHVRSNDSVFVRRWLPSDFAAAMTTALATHGYPDAADLAQERSAAASGQNAKAIGLTVGAAIAGIGAAVCGIVAARRHRRARPKYATR